MQIKSKPFGKKIYLHRREMKRVLLIFLSFMLISLVKATAWEGGNAVSEMDMDNSSEKQFWKDYIEPEFLFFVNMSTIEIDCDQASKTTVEAMEDLQSCIQPSITTLKELDHKEIGKIWSSKGFYSKDSLAYIRQSLLEPFCYHAPIIFNCYLDSFASHIENCLPSEIPTLKYFQRLLPSICEHNGTRLESLLNVNGQMCVWQYLDELILCSQESSMLTSDSESSLCMTINCVIQRGNQKPCRMSKESETSLHFLLDHIHDMGGCRTSYLANVINSKHQRACDSANIPHESEKFVTPLRSCIEPFLAFSNFLLHITDSTLKRTNYVRRMSTDVNAFIGKIDDVCSQVVNAETCAASIKDVVGTCYKNGNQRWHAFVTYFDTFLQVECQRNGSRLLELFKDGDLDCLVSQLSSAWTCFTTLNLKTEGNPTDLCENLALLHNCSQQNLYKCRVRDSFKVMNQSLGDVNEGISTRCQSPTKIENPPVRNSQQLSQSTIVIIVVPISAAIFFVVLHVVIYSRKRRSRRIPGPTWT